MKVLSKDDRHKIEQAYQELEKVREMLKIIKAGDYFDSLNAEENRLIRFISNIKGLNEPNMN